MQYMLLIYSNEADVAKHTATQVDAQAWMGAWFKYTDELKASGKLVAGSSRRRREPTRRGSTPIRAAFRT